MPSTTLSSSPSTSINTVHETKFVIIYVPIIVPAQQAIADGGIRIDDVLKMNASVLKSPLVKNQVINALNQADLTPIAGPNKYGFELYPENEEPKSGEVGMVDAVSGLDDVEGINLSIDSGPLSVANKQCVKRGSSESTTPSSLETQYCSYRPCTSRSLVQQQLVSQDTTQQSSILSATSPSDTKYCFDVPLHLPQSCVLGGSLISASSDQWVNWNNQSVWSSNNWTVQPWCVREYFEGGFKYCSFSGLQRHHQCSLQACEMHSSEIFGNMQSFGHRKSCERLSSCCIHRNGSEEMVIGSLEGRIFNGALPVQKFSKISQHENKWYFANRVCKSRAKAPRAKALQAAAALAA